MSKSFLRNDKNSRRTLTSIAGTKRIFFGSDEYNILDLLNGNLVSSADEFIAEIIPVLTKIADHLKDKNTPFTKIKLSGVCEGPRCQQFDREIKNIALIQKRYKMNVDDFKGYLMWDSLHEKERSKLARVLSFIFNIDINVSNIKRLIHLDDKKLEWLKELFMIVMITCIHTNWCCGRTETYC